MSEKTVKTVESLQAEYQGICMQIGHLEYQAFALLEEAKTLKQSARDINLEASELQKLNASAAEKIKEAKVSEEG